MYMWHVILNKITCFFAPVSIASQLWSLEYKQAEINTPERDDDQPLRSCLATPPQVIRIEFYSTL